MDQRIQQQGNALVVLIALILAVGLCVAGYFLVMKEGPGGEPLSGDNVEMSKSDVVIAGNQEEVSTTENVSVTTGESEKTKPNTAPPSDGGITETLAGMEVEVVEDQNVRIHGKVVSQDGEPIEGVQLRWVDATHGDLKDVRHDPRLASGAFPGGQVSDRLAKSMGKSKTAQSKSDGTFELRVTSESGVVIASAAGYSTVIQDLEGDEGGSGRFEEIRKRIDSVGAETNDEKAAIAHEVLKSGDTTEITVELDFELTGAAMVSGRVVDEDTGAPATGMSVVLMKRKPGSSGGFMRLMEQSMGGGDENPSAAVDGDGNFAIVGVRAGEYDVIPRTGRSNYVSLPIKKAHRVTLRSGDEVTGVEFQVSLGGSITGIVSDSEGEPIADAKVGAVPNLKAMDFMSGDMDIFSMFEERDNIKTEKDGTYLITALPLDQEYQVTASHPEFASTRGDLVTLSKKERDAQVDIMMLRGSVISGFVHYEDGSVAGEVPVNLMPDMTEIMSGGGIGAFSMMSGGNNHTRTNEEGFFEIKNVSPGIYTVQSGSNFDFSPFGNKKKGVEIDVDGETDITDIALTIEKESGEDVVEAPTGTLVGRVVDDQGNPISGANLSFWAMDGSGSGTSDEGGNFAVDITGEGPFTANIMHSGFTNLSENGIRLSESEIVLTLHRLAGVSGRVTTSDGSTPEGGRVTARPVVEDIKGMQNMFTGFGESGGSAELDPDGSYFIEGVPSGKIEIVAHVPGYAPGTSSPLEVEAGSQIDDINIRVSPGATLVGKVSATDTPALEGATVRLNRDSGNKSIEMFAQMMPAFFEGDGGKALSDERGRYEIPHLAPGKYKLTVSHTDYAPSSAIQIEIGEQREVRAEKVELAPGGSIDGMVLNGEERTPLAGATVQLIGEGPMKMSQSAKDGSFQFEGLPHGEYMLQVMNMANMAGGNFSPKSVTVKVEGTAPTKVEVVFGVGVTISGKVEGLTGAGFQQILVRKIDAPKLEDLDLTDMKSLLEAAKHNVAQGIVMGGEYSLEGVEPGTYYLEVPAMPDDPTDFEAYMEMDRTPLYRTEIVVGTEDITHDFRVKQ